MNISWTFHGRNMNTINYISNLIKYKQMKHFIRIFVLISVFPIQIFSQHPHHDTTQFSIDLHKTTPRQLLSILKYDSDTAKGVKYITVSFDPPKNWVQLEDVKYFLQFMNSNEKCKCVIKVFSSHLPFDDYSTIGAQAMNLIDSYRKNEPYFSGVWNCAKNDSLRALEIKTWWESLNNKK
jgi:hypothetical protein